MGRPADQDNKHEQKLQAVLLALDTASLGPLSIETSQALCRLNNVTLIDYAMEFLAGAGVEELVVVTTSSEVRSHVEHHSWNGSVFKIDCIVDRNFSSEGDALRELDKRNIIKSDPFLLMHGDVVTNVDIAPVIEAHKVRKKKDSSAIMTLLLKPVGGSGTTSPDDGVFQSPLVPANNDLIVGVDPTQQNRVLVYDNDASSKSVSVPCSFFATHPEVELRRDMLDCGIDICSPDVLARFSDAFDYEDIRRQFLAYSVAEEEEGLQNKIHAHLLQKSEYAARVLDFSSYAAISRDLLKRWCYPVVPDNLPSGYEKQYRYLIQRHCLYKETNGKQLTKIGRSSTLRGPGMVGSQCVIQEDCVILRTVLGNNCSVASKATLKDCHLWDNVVVEEGVSASHSVLARNCVVKAGATVGRGCVIGTGCVVGANVTVPDFTRITLTAESTSFNEDFSDFSDSSNSVSNEDECYATDHPDAVTSDQHVVGPDGLGRIWLPPFDGDSDSEEEVGNSGGILEVIKTSSLGYCSSSFYHSRFDYQQEDVDDGLSDVQEPVDMGFEDEEYGDSGLSFGAADMSNHNEFGVIVGRQHGVDVIRELKAMCLEYELTTPIENLGIELNSYKFSQNATYSDCTKAATLAILEKLNMSADIGAKKLVGSLRLLLNHWAPLLRKMSIGIEEEKSIISALEAAAMAGGDTGASLKKEPHFRLVLQTLHDLDVVNEAAILSWASEVRTQEADGSPRRQLFQQDTVQDFLEYLEQESDDDSEESDSDDAEGST